MMKNKTAFFYAGLFAVALLIMGFLAVRYYDPVHMPMGMGADSFEYWDISTNLLEHGRFQYTSFDQGHLSFDIPSSAFSGSVPVTSRMPLYPAILSVLRVVLDNPLGGIILNIMAYIGICLYSLRVVRLWNFSEPAQMVYGILVILSPQYFVRWGVGTDMLISLSVAGAACHLILLSRRDQRFLRDLLMALLWSMATVLLRPNGFLYVLLLVICLLMSTRGLRKKAVMAMAGLACVSVVLLGSWIVRNKALTNAWTLSSIRAQTMLQAQGRANEQPPAPLSEWNREARSRFMMVQLSEGKTFPQAQASLDKEISRAIMARWRDEPGAALKDGFDGVRTYFMMSYFQAPDAFLNAFGPLATRQAYLDSGRYAPTVRWQKKIQWVLHQADRIFKWLVVLALIACPVVLLRQKGREVPGSASLMPLWFWAIGCTVLLSLYAGAGSDRLRMPLQPFYLLFMVFVLDNVLSRHMKRPPGAGPVQSLRRPV